MVDILKLRTLGHKKNVDYHTHKSNKKHWFQ